MTVIIEKRTGSADDADYITLEGSLSVPEHATALIIFSHGTGSSRFNPRNRFVADQLNREGMATLTIDLLSEKEDGDRRNRLDIELLTERLTWVTTKIMSIPGLERLPVGYFGSSTGAAPAIKAAVKQNKIVAAVVCRGGRPDLAFDNVSDVRVPVLLVVGSLDGEILAVNRQAYSELHTKKSLEIIEGASHLFEEPGTLATVADMSAEWFTKHLTPKLEPLQQMTH